MEDRVFVILGASGKVGRSTIAALRREGAPVRAVVRDGSKAAPLAALGCEIAVADLQDAPGLAEAMRGASAVQVICPVFTRFDDATTEMTRSITATVEALESVRPPAVLAISDYGAERSGGTGVTVLFHILEQHLLRLSTRLVLLRSAEHMENWSRVIGAVSRSGVLASLHHPLTKLFPTVAASDVGLVAADLLSSPAGSAASVRTVHVEGPRRYAAADVAQVLSLLLSRGVSARELPRSEWAAALSRGGLSISYARLVTELYEAHNAGLIDARPGVDEICYGRTDLVEALGPVVLAASA